MERWSWYLYNVLLCKIKPVLPGRLILLYVPVACTVLHRDSEFAQTSESICCCWCGSFNIYTLASSEGMLISSSWPDLAVSTILITITSELQVLCFATWLSLCTQISHWCCCRELYKMRGILIFISIMCNWEEILNWEYCPSAFAVVHCLSHDWVPISWDVTETWIWSWNNATVDFILLRTEPQLLFFKPYV